MLALISLLLALHAETCREMLARPIDLGDMTYDRDHLRELTAELEVADRKIGGFDAALDRAELSLALTRERLTRLDRVIPWTPLALLAKRKERRRDRAEIARNVARDEVNWLRIRRDTILFGHPTFRQLIAAEGRAFSAKCDSTICVEDLRTVALRLERTGLFTFAGRELENAREAIQRASALYERLREAAKDLGLEIYPDGLERPGFEHHGHGAYLSLTASEVAHLQVRVRHLNVQLRDLVLEIRARLDAYLLYALEQ